MECETEAGLSKVGSHLRTSVVPDHSDRKYRSQSELQPWTQFTSTMAPKNHHADK